MSEYKWMLRRGSRKEVCPSCGKKRFVPYVLTADPSVAAGPEYGRCDREQSCGYFRYPGGEVKTAAEQQKGSPFAEIKREAIVFPAEFATKNEVTTSNTLFRAYAQLFLPGILRSVMAQYMCGTGGRGECVYFQYDGANVRTAKAILYGKDGHRLKAEDGGLPVWWLHKVPALRKHTAGRELRQCLFGQHLLAIDRESPVFVVEGEKTAVLMTAYEEWIVRKGAEFERHLYLACGGSQMLKGAIDLSCLFGRRVALVPDDGQWLNWSRTAGAYGWECIDIEELKKKTGQPDGCDIWDCYEQILRNYKEGGGR